jgi:hypothetical protein
MCYPWVRTHFISGVESIDEFTNLTVWVARIDGKTCYSKRFKCTYPRIPIELKNLVKILKNWEEFNKFVQFYTHVNMLSIRLSDYFYHMFIVNII